jgi:PIN domain nuclease of toxin-antitoxin system
MRAAGVRRELFVSPISFWEIATLVRKRRVELGSPIEHFLERIETGEAQMVALTPSIARTAGGYDDLFAGDPADRILVATALTMNLRLMTRDRRLLSLDRVLGLHVIAC